MPTESPSPLRNKCGHRHGRLDKTSVEHLADFETGVVNHVDQFGCLEQSIPQDVYSACFETEALRHDRLAGVKRAGDQGGTQLFTLNERVDRTILIRQLDNKMTARPKRLPHLS